MCIVSMINDYGRDRIPPFQWDRPSWTEYQELLRKAAELDRLLKQPNCDTEDKTAWQKVVEEHLRQVEKGGS